MQNLFSTLQSAVLAIFFFAERIKDVRINQPETVPSCHHFTQGECLTLLAGSLTESIVSGNRLLKLRKVLVKRTKY